MTTVFMDELVADYGRKDAEIKALKKITDEEKERIKSYLSDVGESHWTSGGYTVQKIISERETLNEEKLLPILKQYWTTTHGSMECPFIKTAEYIDMDKLEEAIYSKELSPMVLAEMEQCREVTTIVSLKCKKAKEG